MSITLMGNVFFMSEASTCKGSIQGRCRKIAHFVMVQINKRILTVYNSYLKCLQGCLTAAGGMDLVVVVCSPLGRIIRPAGGHHGEFTGQNTVRLADNSFHFLGHLPLPKGTRVFLLHSNYLRGKILQNYLDYSWFSETDR